MNRTQILTAADIILTDLEAGRRGQKLATHPEPETVDHISSLLRRGVTRGIVPQWTLRTEIGVSATLDQLSEISEQIEEGFISGEAPIAWRVDVYE